MFPNKDQFTHGKQLTNEQSVRQYLCGNTIMCYTEKIQSSIYNGTVHTEEHLKKYPHLLCTVALVQKSRPQDKVSDGPFHKETKCLGQGSEMCRRFSRFKCNRQEVMGLETLDFVKCKYLIFLRGKLRLQNKYHI